MLKCGLQCSSWRGMHMNSRQEFQKAHLVTMTKGRLGESAWDRWVRHDWETEKAHKHISYKESKGKKKKKKGTSVQVIQEIWFSQLLLLICDQVTGFNAHSESACSMGDPASISKSGRSPGEGNGYPLQYAYLENPMDGGVWRATVHGVVKSRTRWSN